MKNPQSKPLSTTLTEPPTCPRCNAYGTIVSLGACCRIAALDIAWLTQHNPFHQSTRTTPTYTQTQREYSEFSPYY